MEDSLLLNVELKFANVTTILTLNTWAVKQFECKLPVSTFPYMQFTKEGDSSIYRWSMDQISDGTPTIYSFFKVFLSHLDSFLPRPIHVIIRCHSIILRNTVWAAETRCNDVSCVSSGACRQEMSFIDWAQHGRLFNSRQRWNPVSEIPLQIKNWTMDDVQIIDHWTCTHT
jgi:hypothetical protein